MEKITYGAPRLLDWVAQIRVGAASVKVHFTGGALTSYGITPAEYTTTNKFVQNIIEKSQYYKDGRIIKLRSSIVADAEKPAVVDKKVPSGVGKPTEGPVNLAQVQVECLQDAQAYLQEKYNVPTYKVRSRPTAQKIAYEHGFMFVGPGFEAYGEGTEEDIENCNE